jgi:SET domain-containing protein
MPKVEARPSNIHGTGLFATQTIAAGEVILRLNGRLVKTDTLPAEFIRQGHWQGITPGWCIINSTNPTLFRWVNHSDRPNAQVQLAKRRLIAITLIQADQEIVLDYNLEPMDERCRKLLGALK